MKNDYFAAAKKAAKASLSDTSDKSAAHSAAVAKLKELVPGKPDAFYGDMGWQAVLAARE